MEAAEQTEAQLDLVRSSISKQLAKPEALLESAPTYESKSHPSDSKPNAENDIHKRLLRTWKRLEYYIEEPSIVILFLLMAFVDIMLGSCQLFGGGSGVTIEAVRNVILAIQVFELVLQMIIFRVRFFSHWGYGFDTVLVAARVLNDCSVLSSNKHTLHLLSFLRVWRFVGVVQACVAIEASEHRLTREKLSAQKKSAAEWKRKATSAREDAEREKRRSAENRDLVKGYRDEIDTLREALRIAAEDVAAVRLRPTQPNKCVAAVSKGQSSPDRTESGTAIDVVEEEGADGHGATVKGEFDPKQIGIGIGAVVDVVEEEGPGGGVAAVTNRESILGQTWSTDVVEDGFASRENLGIIHPVQERAVVEDSSVDGNVVE